MKKAREALGLVFSDCIDRLAGQAHWVVAYCCRHDVVHRPSGLLAEYVVHCLFLEECLFRKTLHLEASIWQAADHRIGRDHHEGLGVKSLYHVRESSVDSAVQESARVGVQKVSGSRQ